MTRAVRIVLAPQALRAMGYGVTAVQLGAILRNGGLAPAHVGLMLATIVAGSATTSLTLARCGDRIGRRRAYAALYAALACCGAVIASGAPLWLLALVAMTGALSTDVIESGPFTTLEQVMLAGTGAQHPGIVRRFGLYNAIAALAGTTGALLGTLPPDRWLLGGVLAATGAVGVLLAAQLPATVEVPAPPPRPTRVRTLAGSRGVVTRLAALFAVDSLAGGFVVQAYVGYWPGGFRRRAFGSAGGSQAGAGLVRSRPVRSSLRMVTAEANPVATSRSQGSAGAPRTWSIAQPLARLPRRMPSPEKAL